MLTDVQQTSIDAYHALKSSPKINAQEQKILNAMHINCVYTRHEIAKLTDMETSTVSARVNALIKAGKILVTGTRKCSITRVTVQTLVKV